MSPIEIVSWDATKDMDQRGMGYMSATYEASTAERRDRKLRPLITSILLNECNTGWSGTTKKRAKE